LVVSVFATLVCPWLLPVGAAWQIAIFVTAVVVTAWIAGQRGNVCGAAYRKTLFSPGGRTTLIRDLERRASSVWCATDLRTARQVYFGPRYIYGYTLGCAAPADVALHKAVQASAAFPGGFPPTRISTRSLHFRDPRTEQPRVNTRPLVLADGGVYDNMADQWARGFADRLERWPGLEQLEQRPDVLIVVNSSSRKDWMPFRARIPLWGEVAALLRDMSVLYENTTAVRRQDLVERFDERERTGSGMRGCLVMIGQSPYRVADYYARAEQRALWPDRGRRADGVLALLGPDDRGTWQTIVDDNSAVPTTLGALGVEHSARLLYQAYVLAMCNAHVVLGYPMQDLPELGRFRNLVRGMVGER